MNCVGWPGAVLARTHGPSKFFKTEWVVENRQSFDQALESADAWLSRNFSGRAYDFVNIKKFQQFIETESEFSELWNQKYESFN